MAGTKAGGKAAAATNTAKYGPDFYKQIGSMGGKVGKTGGFAWMVANGQRDKVSAAGKAGGTKSRRTTSNQMPVSERVIDTVKRRHAN